MQVVINISDDLHEWINDPNKCLGDYGIGDFIDLIKNATPLSKGHGRLIDADKIQFENNEFETYNDYSEAFNAIYFAPTIIEADRSKEE